MIHKLKYVKFVAGYGTVIRSACNTTVFRYKQAQEYSRTHQLSFIKSVSWSARNADSYWLHLHITLIQEWGLKC